MRIRFAARTNSSGVFSTNADAVRSPHSGALGGDQPDNVNAAQTRCRRLDFFLPIAAGRLQRQDTPAVVVRDFTWRPALRRTQR